MACDSLSVDGLMALILMMALMARLLIKTVFMPIFRYI